MGGHDLACHELVELVDDYLSDALAPGDRALFERHLRECPDCSRHVELARAVVAATGRLREEDLGAEALEELLRAFRDWPREAAGA